MCKSLQLQANRVIIATATVQPGTCLCKAGNVNITVIIYMYTAIRAVPAKLGRAFNYMLSVFTGV